MGAKDTGTAFALNITWGSVCTGGVTVQSADERKTLMREAVPAVWGDGVLGRLAPFLGSGTPVFFRARCLGQECPSSLFRETPGWRGGPESFRPSLRLSQTGMSAPLGMFHHHSFGHRDRNARWRDVCNSGAAEMARRRVASIPVYGRDTVPQVDPMERRRPDGTGAKGTGTAFALNIT